MTSRGDPQSVHSMSQQQATPPPLPSLRYQYSTEEDEKPSIVVFTGRQPSGMAPATTATSRTWYNGSNHHHAVNYYPHKEYRYDSTPAFGENADLHSSLYDRPSSVPRDYRANHPYHREQMMYPYMHTATTNANRWPHHSQSKSEMMDLSFSRSFPPYHRQTPYLGYTRYPSSSHLPEDFMPPFHNFVSPQSHVEPPSTPAAKVTPDRSTPPETSSFSRPNLDDPLPPFRQQQHDMIADLGKNDIVCGRGAPTNFQRGNHEFRKLVAEYQTIYLCSKRSDKPKIAMEVMDVLKAREARFVRRVKSSRNGRFCWEEIDEKRAYEKVCQALREGAPEFRQKMLASVQSSSDSVGGGNGSGGEEEDDGENKRNSKTRPRSRLLRRHLPKQI